MTLCTMGKSGHNAEKRSATGSVGDALAKTPGTEAAVAALNILLKITMNCAKNPTEAKYRTLKLTNAKIAAAVAEAGVREALDSMGWQQEGETLVLPENKTPNGAHTRDIQGAQQRVERGAKEAFKKHMQKKVPVSDEVKRMREELKNDQGERAVADKVTRDSVATAAKFGANMTTARDIGIGVDQGG